MKYSLNRSKEENIADLIVDAGLDPVDSQVVLDSLDDADSAQTMFELEDRIEFLERGLVLIYEEIKKLLDDCEDDSDFQVSQAAFDALISIDDELGELV